MPVAMIRGTAWEDTSPFLMARVAGGDAVNLQQADVTSIAYTVYDLTAGALSSASASLTVSSVIFDTLQTNARWTVDSTGYNFGFALPAAKIPTGDNVYVVDVAITPASGAVIPVIFRIETKRRYQS